VKEGSIVHESVLTSWATFYVIIGSAAATLTGLMFVVITLITGTQVRRPDVGIAAFSTPTIVHFCVALAVAAGLSAPWHVLWHAGLLLGLSGLGGLAYSVVVVRRMRRQPDYRPVLEDWSWHVIFPLISYVAFVVAAMLLPSAPETTLFGVAAAMVLLLFIGIHNAWDNVTYLVVDRLLSPGANRDEDPPAAGPSKEQTRALPDALPATASFSSPDGPLAGSLKQEES
jgi:hypothetical protein